MIFGMNTRPEKENRDFLIAKRCMITWPEPTFFLYKRKLTICVLLIKKRFKNFCSSGPLKKDFIFLRIGILRKPANHVKVYHCSDFVDGNQWIVDKMSGAKKPQFFATKCHEENLSSLPVFNGRKPTNQLKHSCGA